MPRPPASAFRLDPETYALLEALAARYDGNKTEAIRQALRGLRDAEEGATARYQTVLAAGRREARAALSQADLEAIFDACRGWLVTPTDLLMLWQEVQDRDEPGDAELAARLRALPASAVAALVDAAERYWAATGKDGAPATPAAFMGGAMRR